MRDALPKDKARVISILGNSFEHNKSVNHLVKQDQWYLERIRLLMDYAFEECMEFGRVVISEDRSACALILFKDKKKINLRSIFRDLRLIFSVIGFSNIRQVRRKEKKLKIAQQAGLCDKPVYYLWFIGVHANFQGRGAGTKLLSELILESRTLRRAMLLETSTESNLRFYEKAGLKVYHQLDVGYPVYMLKM
jgi:GNAT superfamily N-acetyltransferase